MNTNQLIKYALIAFVLYWLYKKGFFNNLFTTTVEQEFNKPPQQYEPPEPPEDFGDLYDNPIKPDPGNPVTPPWNIGHPANTGSGGSR